ncbi:hypothetical protein AB6A40_002973 [Gnathostoma spinigerum]|uniref:Uncharacterized protein n=1 Tax=Gnathostoma spinigerum TaxID=75299 RepID=A0ABD6EFZ3_9BILA
MLSRVFDVDISVALVCFGLATWKAPAIRRRHSKHIKATHTSSREVQLTTGMLSYILLLSLPLMPHIPTLVQSSFGSAMECTLGEELRCRDFFCYCTPIPAARRAPSSGDLIRGTSRQPPKPCEALKSEKTVYEHCLRRWLRLYV